MTEDWLAKAAQELPSRVGNAHPTQIATAKQEIVTGKNSEARNNKQEQTLNVNLIFPVLPPNVPDNPTLETQALPSITFPNLIAPIENVISLYIKPNGEKQWLIYGELPHLTPISIEVKKIPDTNIRPNDLRSYAKKNRDIGKVLNWLNEAIAYFSNSCSLVIIDSTSQQISWEMVELEFVELDSQGEGKRSIEYLGIKIPVVRWVNQLSRGKNIRLEGKQSYEGKLVTYEHPINTSYNDLERCLIPWRNELNAHPQQPVAIALLHFPQTIEVKELITKIALERISECRSNRPLFLFSNFSYSARLILDDEYSCDLVAEALHEVASSYLGTQGEVEVELARRMKNKFLEFACKDKGVSSAKFLQGVRKWCSKSLVSEDPRERQLAEQIFSYVYYGNPDDVVKITEGGRS